MSFLVLQSSRLGREKERAGRFTLITFLLSLGIIDLCLFLAVLWVGLWSLIHVVPFSIHSHLPYRESIARVHLDVHCVIVATLPIQRLPAIL